MNEVGAAILIGALVGAIFSAPAAWAFGNERGIKFGQDCCSRGGEVADGICVKKGSVLQ
jgi:hypothetical protein